MGDRAGPGRLGPPKSPGLAHGGMVWEALPLLAVFYVCIGSTITFNATPQILRKGGVLLGIKALCGVLVAIVVGRMLGEQPVVQGFFAGCCVIVCSLLRIRRPFIAESGQASAEAMGRRSSFRAPAESLPS